MLHFFDDDVQDTVFTSGRSSLTVLWQHKNKWFWGYLF